MPVNSQHADYAAMLPVWQTCRDVAGGQRQVHKAAEKYLPRLKGESNEDYEARKARALFFNATWRTIAGLVGLLFRKDPTYKVSTPAEPMLEDVTQTGIGLVGLARKISEDCLKVGRVGLLVDYPKNDTEGLTVADVEALNMRPKMATYAAETIINWSTAWIANKCVLSRVVLTESATLPGADEFTSKSETRYRVLDLAEMPVAADGTGGGYAYRVRVFRKGKNNKDELVEGPFFPKMGGKVMSFIPFVFIGVDNTTPAIEEPPLVDLVYANISHYQSTADVEHGAHKTALPQPYATGLEAGGDPDKPGAKPAFYMGGGELWMHPLAEGTFGMLEYQGKGLDAIEKRLERKEKHMAVLGARMLEEQKRQVETAEAAGIHRSGEQATLATQGKTVGEGLEIALAWFDLWAGGSGEVEFALNDDFLPVGLSAQEITALVGAWQQGTLSSEELFVKFQKGGVIRETTDYATHEAQVQNAGPRLAPAAPVVPAE